MSRKGKRKSALQRHLGRLEARIHALSERSRRLSWIRLFVFLGGSMMVVAALLLFGEWASAATLAAGIAVFAWIALHHSRIEKMLILFERAAENVRSILARMDLDWGKLPSPAKIDYDSKHPFGFDLDIIGKESLHQLIDRSVSAGGHRRLADWLLESRPDLERISERRETVKELIPKVRFRHRLHSIFSGLESGVLEGESIHRWLESHPWPATLKRDLKIASFMTAVNAALFVGGQLSLIPQWWILTFCVYVLFFFYRSKTLHDVLSQTEALDDELGKYRRLFRYIEQSRYEDASRLKTLCHPFLGSEDRPSLHLRRVKTASAMAGFRMNPFLAVALNVALPWDFYTVWRMKVCRDRVAGQLPLWLDRFSELEALISLAGFAWMNPDFVFPEEREERQPVLSAQELGHPMLRDGQRICNDAEVAGTGSLWLITGSNMAGKSTFLKTVGINLVLAQAGAPVCARRFSAIPFRIFSCMRISDSLTDGYSYFYAEVRRLKALLDQLSRDHDRPLLYLIDEIFRGTNNRERLLGSRAYVRAAAKLDGVGLIATHDLDLVHLADELPQVSNYHFREEVLKGKMVFDYLLHEGPCPTTNALKIMEMEGLPVDKMSSPASSAALKQESVNETGKS